MRKIKIGMFGRIVLAILVFLDDIDKTKAQEYQDLKALIRRAAKYGLDTYLYSYIKAFAHPRDEGGKEVFERTRAHRGPNMRTRRRRLCASRPTRASAGNRRWSTAAVPSRSAGS